MCRALALKGTAASPATKKLAANQFGLVGITGTGKDGRITKEDVASALLKLPRRSRRQWQRSQSLPPVAQPVAIDYSDEGRGTACADDTVARQCCETFGGCAAGAAMLTTFNEVDMQPIMTLVNAIRQNFKKAHNDTRLGFMSFFVRHRGVKTLSGSQCRH